MSRAIEEVERELAKAGQKLYPKAKTPITLGYQPEFDQTPELDGARSNYYWSLIGVLRWIVELGRLDIIFEVGLFSRFVAAPRQGHLDQVFHIFAYLKKYG